MVTISLSNQKGGVGKTTTAFNLGVGLVNSGYRVLLVDCDPQCNLTSSMQLPAEKKTKGTLLDVLREDATIKECLYTPKINLDILTGSKQLNKADKEFSDLADVYLLNDALVELNDEYDFCLIDTPPNIGVLTTNALIASEFVLVPMTPDYFSLQGVVELKHHIDSVKRVGCEVELLGLLLGRFDHTNLSKDAEEAFAKEAEKMGTTIFETKIRQSVTVRQSQASKQDVFAFAPTSQVANDFNDLVKEFIRKVESYNGKTEN